MKTLTRERKKIANKPKAKKEGSMKTLLKERKKVELPKPKKIEYQGLCTTCKKADFCTFPRDPDRPVLQCDEFDGYEKPAQEIPAKETKIQDKVVDDDSAKFKGLCSICEKRKSCTYPKSEMGVWHCEEYE